MSSYDLVIVGGGLVGAGLAAALRQSNINIALIDARLPDSNDPRLFALNASSCQFLENMGVWSGLAEHAAPIHQVHVSQQRHFGAVRLDRNDISADSLGHVIPAHYIEKALNDLLMSQKNITLYRPAMLTGLSQENGGVKLTVASVTHFMTRPLRRSTTRPLRRSAACPRNPAWLITLATKQPHWIPRTSRGTTTRTSRGTTERTSHRVTLPSTHRLSSALTVLNHPFVS